MQNSDFDLPWHGRSRWEVLPEAGPPTVQVQSPSLPVPLQLSDIAGYKISADFPTGATGLSIRFPWAIMRDMKDIESIGSELLAHRAVAQATAPKTPTERSSFSSQPAEPRERAYHVFSLPFGVQRWVDACDSLEEAVRLIEVRCWELPGLYLVIHAPTASKKYFMATRDCTVTIVPEPL